MEKLCSFSKRNCFATSTNFLLCTFSFKLAVTKQELQCPWVTNDRRYVLTQYHAQHCLSLTALVVGTSKISLTSLRTSDAFIPTCSHQQYVSFQLGLWFKFIQVTAKNEDICWRSWPKSSSRNGVKSGISIFWRVSM